MKIIKPNDIESYKKHLIEEERSQATIDKYIHDITAFCQWINGRGIDKKTVLEYSENQIRISFSGTTPVISNDAILKIKFTAFNNADGAANIRVFETKMYDKTGNPITTYASDGKIDVTNVVYSAKVTNIQSVNSSGRKIVTADVSSDKVVCYLASYKDGALVECDRQYPVNGKVGLSVENISNAQFKFMVWNAAMKPLTDVRNIY